MATYYMSPSGSDSNTGGIGDPWFSFNAAWSNLNAGDTLYLRGGTYSFTARQQMFNRSGTSGNMINIWNYPDETPILTRVAGLNTTYGIEIENCDYIHFKGLEITGWEEPQANSWYLSIYAKEINYCIFEQLSIHDNVNGLYISGRAGIGGTGATGNLILNCDLYRNSNPTGSDPYGDADGLGIVRCNSTDVNTVSGCRMWWNSDDGMDFFWNKGHVIVENTWSFWNGFRRGTFTTGKEGNGIKLGGGGSNGLRTVRNCLSFQNRKWGINSNGNSGNAILYNNTFYQNCYQKLTTWAGGIGLWVIGPVYTVKNNISYDNVLPNGNDRNQIYGVTNVEKNTFPDVSGGTNTTLYVDDDDFVSLDTTGVTGARQADGSLPDLNFMKLKDDSNLVDFGVDVGLDFYGAAPDLGAYEVNPNVTFPSTFNGLNRTTKLCF